MFDLSIIAAPVIGGAIGLVTNGLAIKMLFRPLNPVKIGNYTVPFTPGLIPKEKSRIAHAIGQAVGEQLLDAKTLQNALGSESVKSSFDMQVDQIIESIGSEEGTLLEYLDQKGYLATTDKGVGILQEKVPEYLVHSLSEKQIGAEILDYAMVKIMAGLNPMIAMMAEPAIESAKPMIVGKIEEVIASEAPGFVQEFIKDEYDALLNKSMREIGIWLWPKREMVKEKGWSIYKKLIEEKAESMIRKLDVSKIVEDKINEMDVAFLEKLILDIARKELHSLVWIGGILGMIIGFVNLLF